MTYPETWEYEQTNTVNTEEVQKQYHTLFTKPARKFSSGINFDPLQSCPSNEYDSAIQRAGDNVTA
jgi:hypothetical protein